MSNTIIETIYLSCNGRVSSLSKTGISRNWEPYDRVKLLCELLSEQNLKPIYDRAGVDYLTNAPESRIRRLYSK